MVIARNVNVGEIAGAGGTPMFTIVANNALEVAAEISEGDLGASALACKLSLQHPMAHPLLVCCVVCPPKSTPNAAPALPASPLMAILL
ncbi:MAG: hypothetical protein HC777_00180 [Hyphomonadaceae bacterium]|nr:hypothetical protein [Hyphomonadaceae bacterium]